MLNVIVGAWAKNGSLGFTHGLYVFMVFVNASHLRRVGLCIGQNQMCRLCGGKKLLACLICLLAELVNRFAYLFLKNVRWEKIQIQKGRLLGRLSDGSFVPLLYVYFCRSFLLCRLLGLQVTFWRLAQWRISEHKVSIYY